MKVLLDTTALIDIMKKNENLIEKIEELRSKGSFFYTTTVNTYEVLRGIKILKDNQKKHLEALKILEANLYLAGLDQPAAQSASDIYAELRKNGKEIDEDDYLIAGICISNGIKKIITRNEKHFSEINGLEVLSY